MTFDLEPLGSVPRAIAAAALLVAAAFGVGRLLIDSVAWRRRPVDAVLIRLAIGLNLVGLLGIALGQMKLLAGWQSLWLLAACSLGNLADVRRLASSQLARPFRSPPLSSLLAAAVALITLGPALCYPTGWDELVYHSTLPQRWLADGWPAFYLDLPYSGFPSLGEILFWLVAPLESVIAPRLISWLCWVVGLMILYRLLRRGLRAGSATMLTIALAISPTMLLVSANCYVETILMMNVAAMLLAIRVLECRRVGTARMQFERVSWWRLPVALGVLAGGAATVKLTGFAALAVPCLWYFGGAFQRRKRLPSRLCLLSLSLAVAFAFCAQFYLRPYLATGNPFYPYFATWFTEDAARIEMSRFHHALGAANFGVKSVATFVTGPLLLAFSEDTYDGRFGWQLVGIIVLAALAMASARSRLRRVVSWPLAVATSQYVFWFLTAQQARFAAPAIMALVLAAGLGLARLHGRWRHGVLSLLVIAALCSVPWRTAGYYLASWFAVTGRFTWTHYVDEGTDYTYLPLVEALRDRKYDNANVMLLFEPRGFYLPRAHVIGTPFFQETCFTPPERFAGAEEIMSVLHRQGITHVVMSKVLGGPDRVAGWSDRLEPLIGGINNCVAQGRLAPVWQTERYAILEVR